jgi:TonB family protein
MKRCSACREQFKNQYSFCPIDGASLSECEATTRFEYRPTLISDRSLPQRLINEVRFVTRQILRTWPEFKAHPVVTSKAAVQTLVKQARLAVARPHLASGVLTAGVIVLCVVLAIVVLDRKVGPGRSGDEADEFIRTTLINFRDDSAKDKEHGVGAGDKGRVGFDQGRGEGSRSVPARARGGGGGGELTQLPPSQGRLPQPSAIPARIPTTYARLPPQALPVAGIDIDPVLWKHLPFPNYGDPRSKSTAASNGPGQGGGVGTGKGNGIGEGENNGVGPGSKGNIGGGENSPGSGGRSGSRGHNPDDDLERVFRGNEVTTRARVLSKPEPQYTEEARRSQITGTVVLSVVFSRDGQVINIRPVQTLCCGLTEKAIAAARQIRFAPAMRDGKPVPTYMQLIYNFNLY